MWCVWRSSGFASRMTSTCIALLLLSLQVSWNEISPKVSVSVLCCPSLSRFSILIQLVCAFCAIHYLVFSRCFFPLLLSCSHSCARYVISLICQSGFGFLLLPFAFLFVVSRFVLMFLQLYICCNWLFFHWFLVRSSYVDRVQLFLSYLYIHACVERLRGSTTHSGWKEEGDSAMLKDLMHSAHSKFGKETVNSKGLRLNGRASNIKKS